MVVNLGGVDLDPDPTSKNKSDLGVKEKPDLGPTLQQNDRAGWRIRVYLTRIWIRLSRKKTDPDPTVAKKTGSGYPTLKKF